MNPIAEDIKSYLGCSEWDEEQLKHYGMPRRSGRYPYGSGENPYQHGRDFLARVEELKKTGWTETPENIKKEFGLTTTQYRTEKAICKDERRMYDVARAKSLQKDGLGATEIARIMGLPNESSARSLLDSNSESRMLQARKTADTLKKKVDEYGMLDVGADEAAYLRISKEKLNQALYLLEREGYNVYKGGIPQVTNPGQQTNQRVLCKPGVEHKEIYQYDKVHSLREEGFISRDGGDTVERKFHYPESLDSSRLMIRYKEDGGIDKDGVVELRRNVPDLNLGESRYSQVRIMVDGTHYIKGMAVYSDDMPKGVDVIFNTNKSKSVAKMDVLKEIKDDPDNPFGSLIKDADQGGQYWYDAKTGKILDGTEKNPDKKLGLINKRADEGDWSEWADALPSQFLSKQSKTLAKKQLDLAKKDKAAEYEEICSLTNPTIKKHLLSKFAEECDSAAADLKAAALPGQKYHVILPINSLKDNEIYAPGYAPGTKLALIRYPHGGTFEIPVLTVNNKNPDGRKIIGDTSSDAIGINHKIADRLSGADFDGDTVMCIPTDDPKGKVKISRTPPLKDLEGFDPKIEYGPETYKGRNVKLMTKKGTQTEMGKISNLICDMTLSADASPEDLARAVKHSMVVIDAYKHKLDYKQSEIDNNINGLIKKYRSYIDEDGNEHYRRGASTIISRSKGEVTVEKRQGTPKVNIKGKEWYDPSRPEGALIYKTADDLYYPSRTYDKATKVVTLRTSDGKKVTYSMDDERARTKYEPVEVKDPKTGKVTFTSADGTITYKTMTRKQKSTRMAETDDAMTLVSDARHPMELLYADYANSMKAMANRARVEVESTGKVAYNSTAKKTYAKEVESLNEKLRNAELNRSLERTAQRMANVDVATKIAANPTMDNGDIRKANQRAISKARDEVGSIARRERNIDITAKEWEAIQAGAISESQLKRILNNTDTGKLRELATPRTKAGLTDAQVARAKAYASSNYTLEQIAAKLGVSPTTVSKYLKGKI